MRKLLERARDCLAAILASILIYAGRFIPEDEIEDD
jgi:hypothetical protein